MAVDPEAIKQVVLNLLSNAEKYSPEEIEEAIVNGSSWIQQVMIYNDHKKYTTALLTLDKREVEKALKRDTYRNIPS